MPPGRITAWGHITRDRPGNARKLWLEVPDWMGVRRSATLRAYRQRISRGKLERKKIAIVAVAHHLAHVMVAMLRSGEAWRENPPPAGAGTAGRVRRKATAGPACGDGIKMGRLPLLCREACGASLT